MIWRQKRAELADYFTNRLGLDVRFYSRSFLLLTLGHSSGVIRGIATTFLMAWLVSPHVLGQFRYVLALYAIIGFLSLPGMNSAVIRGISQGDTAVTKEVLKRMLLFGPLGTIILIIAAIERFIQNDAIVAVSLLIAAVAFIPYGAVGLYGAILTGQEKIRLLTKVAITNNLVYAAIMSIIIYFFRNLVMITFAYFLFDILLRGFFTLREYRKLELKGDAKKHLPLGNHLSGMGILQSFASRLDQILIQRFFGYSSLAIYSVAIIIPDQIKNAVTSISGTVLQRIARHDQTVKIQYAIRKHFHIAILLSIGVTIAYVVTAPYFLPILFPQYTEAVIPSVVYSIGLAALASLVGMNYFKAINAIRKLWYFYSLNALLQIATTVILIPLLGIMGAVLAKVATRLISLPLSYPTTKKS